MSHDGIGIGIGMAGDRTAELIDAMTLDEKASLTAGASLWYLPPVERLGIPALKVSDGPSGVRGDSLIGRRSLSLPCGMAVGSTWNPDAGRAPRRGPGRRGPRQGRPRPARPDRVHRAHAAGRPHLRVVLRGPAAHRPHRRRLRAAACKSGGVACCIKHYACNDQEHERMTISAEVDERALREIHLVAFEEAVSEAGVWSVMTAYNKVNGTYCGEQPELSAGSCATSGASTGSSCPTGSGRTRRRRPPWPASTSRCRGPPPGSVPPWPPPSATAPSTRRSWTRRCATSCG